MSSTNAEEKQIPLALARKTTEGEIAVATLGEELHPEILTSLSAFQDLISTNPKGIKGLIVKDEPGVRVSNDGFLEIPVDAGGRDSLRARELASLVDAKPDLINELPLLGHVTDNDIKVLAPFGLAQASSYIQIKASKVPKGYARWLRSACTPEQPQNGSRYAQRG